MKNSCLEEIWAARRLIARQTGFSLRRTVEYLRGLEADYPGWVVSFQPRPPDAVWLEPLPRVRAAPRAARASRRLARGTAAASLQARPKSLTPPIARA